MKSSISNLFVSAFVDLKDRMSLGMLVVAVFSLVQGSASAQSKPIIFSTYKESLNYCIQESENVIYSGSTHGRIKSKEIATQFCQDGGEVPTEKLNCLLTVSRFLDLYTNRSTYDIALPAVSLCYTKIDYLCLNPTADYIYNNTPKSREQSANEAIEHCRLKVLPPPPPVYVEPVKPLPPPPPVYVEPVKPLPPPPPVYVEPVKPLPPPPPPPVHVQPAKPPQIEVDMAQRCSLPYKSYSLTGGSDQSQSCNISFGFSYSEATGVVANVNGSQIAGKVKCELKGKNTRIWFTQSGALFQVDIGKNGQAAVIQDFAFCKFGLGTIN